MFTAIFYDFIYRLIQILIFIRYREVRRFDIQISGNFKQFCLLADCQMLILPCSILANIHNCATNSALIHKINNQIAAYFTICRLFHGKCLFFD